MKKTSIEPARPLERVKKDQLSAPTLGIIIFLVVVFFTLKSFVYTKDPKRHGK